MSDGMSVKQAVSESKKWPLAVGSLLIISGIALLLIVAPSKLLPKILIAGLTELGFALVIAWVLTVTIELRSREKHDAEIASRNEQFSSEVKKREKILNKNIFDYIYSIRLPKTLFLSVEKHIFQSPFLKKNQRIEYCFEERRDGWLLIRGEFEYTISNVSRDVQTYEVQFYIEKELGEKLAPFPQHGFYKAIIGGQELSSDELRVADENAEDNSEYQRFKKACVLKPNEDLEVILGFYLRKRTTDSELWQTIDLCSLLDVRVRFNPSEFDLHITPVHPSDSFSRREVDEFGVRVRLDEPLLKGNGIFIWWSPTNGDAPKQLSDQSINTQVPIDQEGDKNTTPHQSLV